MSTSVSDDLACHLVSQWIATSQLMQRSPVIVDSDGCALKEIQGIPALAAKVIDAEDPRLSILLQNKAELIITNVGATLARELRATV